MNKYYYCINWFTCIPVPLYNYKDKCTKKVIICPCVLVDCSSYIGDILQLDDVKAHQLIIHNDIQVIVYSVFFCKYAICYKSQNNSGHLQVFTTWARTSSHKAYPMWLHCQCIYSKQLSRLSYSLGTQVISLSDGLYDNRLRITGSKQCPTTSAAVF